MKNLRLAALSILLLSTGAIAQSLTQLTPQINHWGGVVGSAAVNPSNPLEILIGTGAGGMYRSFTAGRTWMHIDDFPALTVNYVSFRPRDPNTIIATSAFDTKTLRGGGIWRSNDGGVTWDRPAESIPPMTARCPERVSAHGISWAPDTDTVWVATDCGLMRSEDAGAHWTNVIVDPMSGGGDDRWDHRFRPDRVFAVLAIDRQRVIAGGESGYYYMNDGLTWHRSVGEAPNFYCSRAIAVAPGNSRLLFRADYDSLRLRFSEDQGVTWTDFPGDDLGTGNIAPWVRTTTSGQGPGWFELYFGTGVNLKRAMLSTNPAIWRTSGVTWQQASLDHTDPQDIAFHPVTKRPLLLVGDFGTMNTDDDGVTWKSVGGGPDGLNAIEVYGLAAQRFDLLNCDLNFVTWHNWAWSSQDSGGAWVTNPDIAEGNNMRGSGPLLASPADAGIALQPWGGTATLRGRGGQYLSPPYTPPRAESCFRHITFFNSPSDGRPQVLNATYGCEGASVIYDTRPMAGGSWREILRDGRSMYGLPQVATNATGAVLVAAFVNAEGRILLSRATGIERSGPASLSIPAMRNFNSLAVMPWNGVEPVFAVKPDDDRVMIAADATSQKIKRSVNGGNDWQDLDQLTQLVTDDGQLRFYTADNNTQATVIAFDPNSPNRVVIGTLESGILYSTDAGASWERIRGSKQITHVAAIGFDGLGAAYIGTSGRGIWRWGFAGGFDLTTAPLDYLRTLPLFLDPATGERSHEIDVIIPPPGPYPFGVIIARQGYIDDAIFDGQGRLTLALSDKAALAAYDPMQTMMQLNVIASKGQAGFKSCGGCADALKKGGRVKAVVYEKGRIKALGFGDETAIPDKLLFAGQSPIVYQPTLVLMGGVEAPGFRIAKQGAKITVVGAGFAPSGAKTALVRIYLNGRRVAEVDPDAKGGFSISIELKTRPGQGAVTCTQTTNSGRLMIERALLVENLDDVKE